MKIKGVRKCVLWGYTVVTEKARKLTVTERLIGCYVLLAPGRQRSLKQASSLRKLKIQPERQVRKHWKVKY